MTNLITDKIKLLIKNIDDIQECIECSNFELMNQYIQLFLSNYTKSYMDIIGYSSQCDIGLDDSYWIEKTNEILQIIKSQDVFSIMDSLYFGLRKTLLQLVEKGE